MTATLLQGDCLEVLKTLPDRSVQCCVTSPPFFGLRDYGTARWEGGDPNCDHIASERRYTEQTASSSSAEAFSEAGPENAERLKKGRWRESGYCTKCGAVKIDAQIGLEETPEAYVEKLVAVFREVRRVLKDDGTLWLNLGDSFAGSGGVGNQRDDANKGNMPHFKNPNSIAITRSKRCEPGPGNRWGGGNLPATGNLKPKDLIGIPWMVAFALRADGWWLRNDIIWAKPNPMPESVTDRCTRSHEYIFLLTKSARYFYDAEAIKEDGTMHPADWNEDGTQKRESVARKGFDSKNKEEGKEAFRAVSATRNKRDVWTVTTKPYKGAHFATYPPDLIEPCILAGTSAKGECPHCGKAWIRVVERTAMVIERSERTHELGRTRSSGTMLEPPTSTTIGWKPQCDCPEHEPVHQVVLDPFAGSGTTMEVAIRHNRDGVGIELNPKYIQLIKRRLKKVQPFLPME